MKPWLVSLCTLGLWAWAELSAPAAWNNVFQPTLFGRRSQTTTHYYVPPAVVHSSPAVSYAAPVVAAVPTCSTCQSAPQPTQQCTTKYTQRCYYQPVTTYESRSYYEPVTTYQTSYYYEPVTSYRYSCYYDPCTCSYRQVAVPQTSYQLRAQCSPVQNWVQRCAQVPVTRYQQSCYLEPQTTCCTTTNGPMIPVSATQPALAAAPVTPAVPTTPPPAFDQQAPTTPPPAFQQQTPTTPPPAFQQQQTPTYQQQQPPAFQQQQPPAFQQQQVPTTPPPAFQQQPIPGPAGPTTGTNWRPSPGYVPAPAPQVPAVRLDRIAFGPESTVNGQVVRNDQSPRPNATVIFFNQETKQREFAQANSAGRFHVTLASGNWHVFLENQDGSPVYHSQVRVEPSRATQLTLVNR